MFRRAWQSAMIGLARSPAVKGFMQTARATSFLRQKYVAGPSISEAQDRALMLVERHGIRSSIFFMGEYVDDPALVYETIEQKISAADAMAAAQLDIHISVDPTQIGQVITPEAVEGHARQIAARIGALAGDRDGVHCLMLDMEDASFTEVTIALHDALQDAGLPVALTLQAYRHRSLEDLTRQVARGSRVRLVKGAFAAGPALALQSQSAIKANFRRLIDLMLSAQARAAGFYPIIATHDTALHEHAIAVARRNGWEPGSYEFELLLGVREDVSRALAAKGERVRLYVPFGRDWWPHAVRRIGENPRNAVLLARSLVG